MLLFNKKRVFSLLFHLITIMFVLEILGVGHLVNHPIVIGAVFLSYYDLWIKR